MIIQRGSFVSENMIDFIRQNFIELSAKTHDKNILQELKFRVD